MENRGLSQISKREIGIQPSNFLYPELMSGMGLYKQWTPPSVGNPSLTNIHFDRTGEHMFCSFGESTIQLLGWEAGTVGVTYNSGLAVIRDFQIMPNTDDSKLVLCGQNGDVIHGELKDAGVMETRLMGSHDGVATKVAVQPRSPYVFYSCGLDGDVFHYDVRANGSSKLFTCSQYAKVIRDICTGRSFLQTYCPTIAVNPVNTNYFCVGGFDREARVYDIRMYIDDNPDEERICVGKYSPPTPIYTHTRLAGDTDFILQSLAYSSSGELLVSYNGGGGAEQRICLFPKGKGFSHWLTPLMDATVPPDVLNGYEPPTEPLMDVLDSLEPLVYTGHRATWGIRSANFLGYRDEYIMCGSTCGFIYIWDKKSTELVQQIPGDMRWVYLVKAHPKEMVFASFGEDSIVNMWAPTPDYEDEDKHKALPLPDNSGAILEWEQAEAAREAKIWRLRRMEADREAEIERLRSLKVETEEEEAAREAKIERLMKSKVELGEVL